MATKIQKATAKLEAVEAEVKGLFYALDILLTVGNQAACTAVSKQLGKAQTRRNAAFQAWIKLY